MPRIKLDNKYVNDLNQVIIKPKTEPKVITELSWDMIKPKIKRCLKKLEITDEIMNKEPFIRFESKNNSWTLKRKRKNL